MHTLPHKRDRNANFSAQTYAQVGTVCHWAMRSSHHSSVAGEGTTSALRRKPPLMPSTLVPKLWLPFAPPTESPVSPGELQKAFGVSCELRVIPTIFSHLLLWCLAR